MQLDYNDVQAEATADTAAPARYVDWYEARLDGLTEAAGQIAAHHGLSPRETHMLKTLMLIMNISLFFEPSELWYKTKEAMNTAHYRLTRRIPHDDLTCLMFPDELSILLNKYQNCKPIQNRIFESIRRQTTDTDSVYVAADMAIMGTDGPSTFLQLLWLNDTEYYNHILNKPQEVLQMIEHRKSMMTSDYMKARIDGIRQKLTSPGAYARTLPEGKATDIFNAIMKKYRGKYVYVDFWGTRCRPCRLDIEKSQALRDSLSARQDIELVFISGKADSPQKEYDEYVDKHLKGEECYRISADEYKRLMALFGFKGIPHHELVAPDGRIANSDIDIRHSFVKDMKGFMDDHRLRAKAIGTL